MRITESKLRSVIRKELLESSRQYDHIRSYEELQSMYGGWNSLLTKLRYKIAYMMCEDNSSTPRARSARYTEYENMCQDVGMLRFADEIISDANDLYRDPFFP